MVPQLDLLHRLASEDDPWASDPQFLVQVVIHTYQRRRFQTEVINEMPLYPTERVLWDENQVPDIRYTGAALLSTARLQQT